MMKYFYGPDTYGARLAIGELSKKEGEIRWVDRDDLEIESITTILDAAGSSLFGQQLVVVRDPSSFPKSLQETLVAAVKSQQDRNWVLWDREKPDKRAKLFLALKKYKTEFPQLALPDIQKWIVKEFPTVTREAAKELGVRCELNRWRIVSEVEKLLLTCDPVNVSDVQNHLPFPDAIEEVFPFLDALVAGNTKRALQSLENLLLNGNSELYILSMLGYQYKTLFAVVSGKTEKLHPFVVQKNQAIARKYTKVALQNVLARLSATDFAIKQGKIDQRTAITMLTLSLAGEAQEKSRS